MKIIDLSKNSDTLAEKYINEYCGGRTIQSRWTNLLNRGIGGLIFVDPDVSDEQKPHRVIISFFKNGLGFYFRNSYRNKLILLSKDQIKSIEITKNQDIIKPYRFSLFSILTGLGVQHNQAFAYLSPKEIIIEQKAKCILRTDDQYFDFLIEKTTPEKLANEFRKNQFSNILTEDIHSPKIIKI